MTARAELEAAAAAAQATLTACQDRLASLIREEMLPIRRALHRLRATFPDDLRLLEAGRTVVYTNHQIEVMRLAPLPVSPTRKGCYIPPTACRWTVDSARHWTRALSTRVALGEPVVLVHGGSPRAVIVPIEWA